MASSGGIVIVGGGLAAARTAEQLRRSEYAGPITIVSDEDHLPYDRPPLSKEVLRSETDDVTLKPAEFYDEQKLLSERDLFDFVFGNVVRFYTRSSPAFFKGTVVETQVERLLAASAT